jgi:hypothetical protein
MTRLLHAYFASSFALVLGLASSGCVINGSDGDDDGADDAADDAGTSDAGTSAADDGADDAADDAADDGPGSTAGADDGPADSTGADDGPLAMCAGSYSGTFTGDDAGLATAELASDGVITLTFTTSAGPTNTEGTVTEDGVVSGSQDATTAEGTMDLSDCSMEGTWITIGFGDGDWQLTKD